MVNYSWANKFRRLGGHVEIPKLANDENREQSEILLGNPAKETGSATNHTEVPEEAQELSDIPQAMESNVVEVCQSKMEQGDYQGALLIIDEVYTSFGNQERVPLEGLQADCFRALGKLDSARDCYNRIFSLTNSPPAWAFIGLGNVLERKREIDEAIDSFTNALALEYSGELAMRIVKLSTYSSSVTECRKSVTDLCLDLESHQSLSESAIDLCEYYLFNDGLSEANRILDRLIDDLPQNSDAFKEVAELFAKRGHAAYVGRLVDQLERSRAGCPVVRELVSFCAELKVLGSWNGNPCICIDGNEKIENFELLINGLKINGAFPRYARPLIKNEDNDVANCDDSNNYLMLIPPCYVDSEELEYTITLRESNGRKRQYSREYLTKNLVESEAAIYQGRLEYAGGSTIQGWFYSEIDPCASLALYVNSEYVEDIDVKKYRPDVLELRGENYRNCGFKHEIDTDCQVDRIELRNVVTDRPVLGTPVNVQRIENAVGELESLVAETREKTDLNINGIGVSKIFESLRQMPDISLDYRNQRIPKSRELSDGLSVIIPVYNGLTDVQRCLNSLVTQESSIPYEIICINDCSPDAKVIKYLKRVEQENENLFILNSEVNRGFVKTVNKGLEARRYKDVVILNSDTVLPPGFVERIRAAHAIDERFGVIVPLSNNATIFSFPLTLEENRLESYDELLRIDSLLRENTSDELYEMPTGHGYCMFVAGDVLDAVGQLNDEEWGLGYGEENDYCQRVKMHGWKIGAYYGMYVGHVGSVSFGTELRDGQTKKNLQRLCQIYPDYDPLIRKHISSEGDSRLVRNQLQIINYTQKPARRVLFITHDLGGGTTEYTNRCIENFENDGIEVLKLSTIESSIVLCDNNVSLKCDYQFTEISEMVDQLTGFGFLDVIVNSMFNYPEKFLDKVKDIVGNYSVVIHDYAWLCPKINLIDATGSYCGVPGSDVCVKCVEATGSHPSFHKKWKNVSHDMDIWLTRNTKFLEQARLVITPSHDAANRLKTRMPKLNPVTRYHSDTFELSDGVVRYSAATSRDHVIGVFGMIGDHKGMQIFAKLCWILTSRMPGVRVVFFGGLSETEWMDGYPNVECVGKYDEDSLRDLIAEIKPTVALYFSVWPETYCYALTDAIRNGVYPVAFDIGAFKERVEMHNYGSVIPFDTEVQNIYEGIREVLDSEKFQQAKISDIADGAFYDEFSKEYFEIGPVTSTIRIVDKASQL